jgi:hypothetical protein
LAGAAGDLEAAGGDVHGLVEGAAGGGRGDGDDRVGVGAVADRGGEVVAHHAALEVLASHDRVIGPASWVGGLQLVPPLVEEMNPTESWQVAAVQLRLG